MSKTLKNGVFEARRRRIFFENRDFYEFAPPLFSEIWKQGGGRFKGIPLMPKTGNHPDGVISPSYLHHLGEIPLFS